MFLIQTILLVCMIALWFNLPNIIRTRCHPEKQKLDCFGNFPVGSVGLRISELKSLPVTLAQNV